MLDVRIDCEFFFDWFLLGRWVGYELVGFVWGRERGIRGDRFVWLEFSVWEVRENLGFDFMIFFVLVWNFEFWFCWIWFYFYEVWVLLVVLLFGFFVFLFCFVVWFCEGCVCVVLICFEVVISFFIVLINCCFLFLSFYVYFCVFWLWREKLLLRFGVFWLINWCFGVEDVVGVFFYILFIGWCLFFVFFLIFYVIWYIFLV